ncbi:polymeric immunoglobulin receptor-like [Pygocentrus nattereri]|uniref:polymeric immunoglobulin receptor-like n=1 Tax=Pygocentrus nattereri TaxID=42514 RepID=UPI0018912676|nr:polymeric immunoglobulin receptor-like [Pygocentrus nattereri]
MIRELTVEDSGTYKCGVYKSGFDVFTPVELKVEEDLSYEKSISVTGHVGGSVNISCKYPQSHSSYPKFLCRRVGTVNCSYETSVKESRRWRNEGKLYLHDDGKQTFTVIINRLTEGDSGEYWCGAESDWTSDHGYKVFITQINLTVTGSISKPETQSTSSTSETAVNSSFKTSIDIPPQSSTYISSLTTEPTTSSTSKSPSSSTSASASSVTTAVSVLILVLLLIGLAFLILCLQKRGKIQETVAVHGSGPLISELVLVCDPELRMKILLIFTLFLISVGGGESERVMGYSGGGVLIKCRYETQYTSNPKYLCEAPWPCMTKPIWTDAKNEWIHSGRFSLFDDTRAAQFWVVIRELTVKDSGKYKCAVDKDLAIDVYTPVELKVEEDLSYEKSISVTGHVGGGVNISCKYPQSHSSYPKFLCRRVGPVNCSYETSVKESRRWRNEGKLYLHDDGKQTFTVIINRLTEGDSGEYWCGAESDWTSDHGYKTYITQINLGVTGTASPSTSPSSPAAQTREINAPTTTIKSSSKTSTEILPQSSTYISSLTTNPTTSSMPKTIPSSLSVSSVLTGVSVIVLLLLFGLLFFIVFLRRRGKTQDPGTTQSQFFRGFSAVHRLEHLRKAQHTQQ